MRDLATARQSYAEEIKYRGQVSSPRLLRAFATIPREKFLGEGPWRIRSEIVHSYWTTEDADPVHLYHDVLVAMNEELKLDNALARVMAAYEPKGGFEESWVKDAATKLITEAYEQGIRDEETLVHYALKSLHRAGRGA